VADEEPARLPVGPVRQPSRRLCERLAWIEAPFARARGGIEGNDVLRGRVAKERASDHERVRLEASRLHVETPDLSQPADVPPVDLVKFGIAVAKRAAAVRHPSDVRRRTVRAGGKRENGSGGGAPRSETLRHHVPRATRINQRFNRFQIGPRLVLGDNRDGSA